MRYNGDKTETITVFNINGLWEGPEVFGKNFANMYRQTNTVKCFFLKTNIIIAQCFQKHSTRWLQAQALGYPDYQFHFISVYDKY